MDDPYEDGSRRSFLLERAWCLATELCLDAGGAMLVPAIVFVPYAQLFNFQLVDFPTENLYSGLWFVEMLMAAQQFFVVASYDFVFTLAPHVGIYFGVHSLIVLSDTRIVKEKTLLAICPQCMATIGSSPATKGSPAAPLSRGPTYSVLSKHLSRSMSIRIKLSVRIDTTVKKVLHFLFAFWGAIVLCLYLVASVSFTLRDDRCMQRVWPWISYKFPCSALEHNCYRQNTSTVPADVFSALEENVLTMLRFTYCSALVVPASIGSFRHLMRIDIYNSTLVDWPLSAAISETSHSSMKSITLARANMTRLPDGLLRPLPVGMIDFEISVFNLSSLPSDLHTRWRRPLSNFYVEHSGLTEFPSALSLLQVEDLSLVDNRITSLTDTRFGSGFDLLKTVVLAGNPVIELPTQPPPFRALEVVSLENMQVAQLPRWLTADFAAAAKLKVLVTGTPFCRAQPSETRSPAPLARARRSRAWRRAALPAAGSRSSSSRAGRRRRVEQWSCIIEVAWSKWDKPRFAHRDIIF